MESLSSSRGLQGDGWRETWLFQTHMLHHTSASPPQPQQQRPTKQHQRRSRNASPLSRLTSSSQWPLRWQEPWTEKQKIHASSHQEDRDETGDPKETAYLSQQYYTRLIGLLVKWWRREEHCFEYDGILEVLIADKISYRFSTDDRKVRNEMHSTRPWKALLRTLSQHGQHNTFSIRKWTRLSWINMWNDCTKFQKKPRKRRAC